MEESISRRKKKQQPATSYPFITLFLFPSFPPFGSSWLSASLCFVVDPVSTLANLGLLSSYQRKSLPASSEIPCVVRQHRIESSFFPVRCPQARQRTHHPPCPPDFPRPPSIVFPFLPRPNPPPPTIPTQLETQNKTQRIQSSKEMGKKTTSTTWNNKKIQGVGGRIPDREKTARRRGIMRSIVTAQAGGQQRLIVQQRPRRE